MNDLETIARLEYAKVMERISQDAHQKLQNLPTTMPRGGQLEHAKLTIRLDQAEQGCREYARIWESLLEQKNGGRLIRQDAEFIVSKILDIAQSRKASVFGGPDSPRLASAVEEAGRRMDGVVASIRRDLEIKVRKQEAFPVATPNTSDKTQINISIQNAANVNLGSQIGTINAALSVVSQQSNSQDVVVALKEMSEAILKNQQIQEDHKQEALQVIGEIAKQAETKPDSRNLGILKALVTGLHAIVGASNDLNTLWDKCIPAIKHFFHI
jgi:hypothetical protein